MGSGQPEPWSAYEMPGVAQALPLGSSPTQEAHPVTCSFQRKSRRAVDSTCWACRYSASANTSRITGVIYLSATLPAAELREAEASSVSEGGIWQPHPLLPPTALTHQSSALKVSLEEALAGRHKRQSHRFFLGCRVGAWKGRQKLHLLSTINQALGQGFCFY